MSNFLGTTKCIKCGKEVKFHGGHVVGKSIGALGIPFEVKVLAGWCSEECHDRLKSDSQGCYGKYTRIIHGPVMDCYEEMFGNERLS